MNYVNSILNNSVKHNLMYAMAVGGVIYITKSTYDIFSNLLKERNENKEIKNLIEKEKLKFKPENLNNENFKYEICVYLYYKILNTVYKKEKAKFNIKRRDIFASEDIEKYWNYLIEYIKNLKLREESIIRTIYDELKIDESQQEELKPDKINISEIKRKFYLDLETEVPKTLDYQKLNEIINTLYEKTKFYLSKLRDHLNYKDDYVDDKLHLIAEYMAFDYIYEKFNWERDVIEKAIVQHNISIVEKQ